MTQQELQDFETKVRSMRVWEIILAMVEGLRHRWVKLHMNTFGQADRDYETGEWVCYGCAATNAVCEIAGIVFTPNNIIGINGRAGALKCDPSFLDTFEEAIDGLRSGYSYLYYFQSRMHMLGLERIPLSVMEMDSTYALPLLTSDLTEKQLGAYVRLAKYCKSHIERQEAKNANRKEAVDSVS